MNNKKVPQPSDRGQIEEAITLFDGILQSDPEDQVALEALSRAYEQAGDQPLARATLLRLANVILDEKDFDAAPVVIQRLQLYSDEDFDALEALRNLETLVSNQKGAPKDAYLETSKHQPPPSSLTTGVALKRQVLMREMNLAWQLLGDQELNQEEYASTVEDLSRLMVDERNTTISLQHVLTDRAFPGVDKILSYMTKAAKVPFLALEYMELPKADLGKVPLDYLLQQGVLPFGTMGGEYLLALLNPLDTDLQQDLSTQLGQRCHFYLITAEAFDAAREKLLALAEETIAAESEAG